MCVCVCVHSLKVHDIQLGKLREVYTVPALFSVVRAKWRPGHKHHVTRCGYIYTHSIVSNLPDDLSNPRHMYSDSEGYCSWFVCLCVCVSVHDLSSATAMCHLHIHTCTLVVSRVVEEPHVNRSLLC